MRSINVEQGQTLYDIAIQYCGDQSAAIAIALLNNIDLTATLATGTALQIPAVVNRRVASYYANNNIIPATLNSI